MLAGVAIADSWKAKFGEDAKIVFVGASGGIEERLVPRAGYPLELLKLGRLNRVKLAERIKTYFQLPLCFIQSARILIRLQPVAVIGVGGFASGPLVLIARVLGFVGLIKARTAILEQNSIPGMTNRILGKLVHEVFSAFPGTEAHFSGKNVRITGNPVRTAIEDVAKTRPDGPSMPFTVFIFGGSQGAIGINSLMIDSLPMLKSRIGELAIVHQTGERDFERVRDGYTQAGVPARVEKFIYEMPEMYANASLIVCRAGSSTLSEIAAVGRASVLIPFPQASDNHQEYNARVFSDAGAAVLLLQQSSKGADLAQVIIDLLDHPEKRRKMEVRVRDFHKAQAAYRITSELGAPLVEVPPKV